MNGKRRALLIECAVGLIVVLRSAYLRLNWLDDNVYHRFTITDLIAINMPLTFKQGNVVFVAVTN